MKNSNLPHAMQVFRDALAAHRAGEFESAIAGYDLAAGLFAAEDAPARVAAARSNLGNILHELGRLEEAKAHLDSAVTAARAAADLTREANALGNLGVVLADLGDLDHAVECHHAARTALVALDKPVAAANQSGNLGRLALRAGNADAARRHYLDALAGFGQGGPATALANCLVCLGDLDRLEEPSKPANTVVEEYQKGYLVDGRLLRPAVVVVATGGPKQLD